MLVQHLAGGRRAYQRIILVVLVFVTLALSAQAIHWHAHGARCLFCEVGETSLPVLVFSAAAKGHPTAFIEAICIPDSQPAAEGSSLSVRAPPVQELS